MQQSIPILFHIGAPKTATTFLQENYYPYHPDIVYIPHVNQWNRWVWSLDKETAKSIVICEEGVMGQPQKRSNIIKNFKCLSPKAKIVITTRAPDENLLKSIYSQAVRCGERSKIGDYFLNTIDYWSSVFNYRCVYSECCELFGKENVLLLPYEIIKYDLNKFIEIFEQFASIRSFRFDVGKSTNIKMSDKEISFYRYFSRILFPVVNTVRKFLNPAMPPHAAYIYLTMSKYMFRVANLTGSFLPKNTLLEKHESKKLLKKFDCFVDEMDKLSYYKPFVEKYRGDFL